MKKNFNGRSVFTMLFLLGLLFVAGSTYAQAATAYGVTATNQLIRFDTAAPNNITTIGPVIGLQGSENIVGIDFRPANGQLYALSSLGRLFTVNLVTGATTQVGTTGAFTLNGTDFGFDFNPTVDLIRVVSNTGQNLRINPNTGALTAADPNLNPGTPQVTAAAYANNFAGATGTTLFVIDTNTDTLIQQNPANAGTLVSVGALGVDATSVNGFDIAPGTGTAFAALTVGGTTRLYTINLTTGAATAVNTIGTGTNGMRGLAVAFGSAASGGNATALDYDGDRRADFALYRLTNNTFFINRNADNSFFAVPFGRATDIQTPGDYDGDGRADIAVYRPENNFFYVFRSSDGQVQTYGFGIQGDEPVARDYDGDGRTDFAVVRRTGGQLVWYINNSSNNTFRIEQFGLASDVVAPGDYDGDGRFDLAVFRPNNNQQATFFVRQSSNNAVRIVNFGLGSDLVVPGDYDGDGRTDFAVVRQGAPYVWYILRSSDNTVSAVQFGTKPQFTAQADYDGDGRTDIAVYDPASASFFVLRSSDGTLFRRFFGQNGDYPVANYNTF